MIAYSQGVCSRADCIDPLDRPDCLQYSSRMDIYPGKEDTLVYEAHSPMQVIRAFDKRNGLRYMTLDGVQQGGHLPGRPDRLIMPYFRLAFTSLMFVDEPADFLFVGLGMGGMPMYLRQMLPKARIDVVEIDPGVVAAAREAFGFTGDSAMNVNVGDGREFIKNTRKRYDAVFLDAYSGVRVPRHLTTLEFMGELKAALKPGGVAVSNLWGSVVNQKFDSCVRTLAEAFPNLYCFRSYTYNYIFVADPAPEALSAPELLTRAKALMKKAHLGFDMVDMVRRQFAGRVEDDPPGHVLTDEEEG